METQRETSDKKLFIIAALSSGNQVRIFFIDKQIGRNIQIGNWNKLCENTAENRIAFTFQISHFVFTFF